MFSQVQEVLGFKIPMGDTVMMAIIDRMNNLFKNRSSLNFRELAFLQNSIKKLPAFAHPKRVIIYITPSLDTPCLYLQKIHIILLCLDGPLFVIYIGTKDLIISISAFKRSTFFTFFFGITLIARIIFVPFFLPFKTLPNEPVPITWVVVSYYIFYFFWIKFVVFGDRSLVGFAEPKFIWI